MEKTRNREEENSRLRKALRLMDWAVGAAVLFAAGIYTLDGYFKIRDAPRQLELIEAYRAGIRSDVLKIENIAGLRDMKEFGRIDLGYSGSSSIDDLRIRTAKKSIQDEIEGIRSALWWLPEREFERLYSSELLNCRHGDIPTPWCINAIQRGAADFVAGAIVHKLVVEEGMKRPGLHIKRLFRRMKET